MIFQRQLMNATRAPHKITAILMRFKHIPIHRLAMPCHALPQAHTRREKKSTLRIFYGFVYIFRWLYRQIYCSAADIPCAHIPTFIVTFIFRLIWRRCAVKWILYAEEKNRRYSRSVWERFQCLWNICAHSKYRFRGISFDLDALWFDFKKGCW